MKTDDLGRRVIGLSSRNKLSIIDFSKTASEVAQTDSQIRHIDRLDDLVRRVRLTPVMEKKLLDWNLSITLSEELGETIACVTEQTDV